MVPEGWKKTTLGAHLDRIDGGGTPSRKVEAYWMGDIPWATVKDLTAPKLDDTEEHISAEGLDSSASRIIPAGTVITATRMAVGRVAQFSRDVAINQDLKALVPKPSLDRGFLFQWFQAMKPTLKALSTGSTVKGVRIETIRSLELLLPTVPEQRAISEILDSIDDAIQATRAVIEQTRRAKQGLLQGLLTRGIGHTRFKRTEVGEVPEGWRIVPLHMVAEVRTGIAKGRRSLVDPVRVPYLRVANVQDGYLDLTEIKEIEIERSDLDRYMLRDGDVLLTEGGDFDKLGRGDVWRGQIDPCVHQNHVFSVRCDQSAILPEFLALFTRSYHGKRYFLGCAKQTTNLASINSTQLKFFPVLLPPHAEQRDIVEQLDAVAGWLRANKALYASLVANKRTIMKDLIHGNIKVSGAEW